MRVCLFRASLGSFSSSLPESDSMNCKSSIQNYISRIPTCSLSKLVVCSGATPLSGLHLIWNDTLLSGRVLHHQSDPSLQQVHSIRHFDKFYNHPDALRAIFIPTQTQLSRRSCCVATTLHQTRHYISFESIQLSPPRTIFTIRWHTTSP